MSSLLEKFTAVDYLDGINKYYCEHCRNYTEAEIGVVFDDIPKILIFHLKRLTTFDAYGYNRKIMTAVATCPELVLDQCALCSSRCQAKNEKYQLFAIIVHAGVSGSSGHYYSYIRVSNIDAQNHQLDAPIPSKANSEPLDKHAATPDESSSAVLTCDLPKCTVVDQSVNISNPEWVLFNDTVVKWVNDEQLLNILEPKGLNSSSTAYILIYSQI